MYRYLVTKTNTTYILLNRCVFAHLTFSCCRGKSYFTIENMSSWTVSNLYTLPYVVACLFLLLLFDVVVVLLLSFWICNYKWITTTTTWDSNNRNQNTNYNKVLNNICLLISFLLLLLLLLCNFLVGDL